MGRIEVNNSQVNVIEMNAGGGDPVIMLHGLLTNLSLYYFAIAPLVAQEHHVILYDMRSHGLSDRRSEGYTLDIFANDLLDLMETLDVSTAHLVGYSYGGAIALYTALKYPDMVKRLALIETPTLKEQQLHACAGSADYSMFNTMEEYTEATGIAVAQKKAQEVVEQHRFITKDGLLLSAILQDQYYTDSGALERLQAQTLLLYGTRSELFETGLSFATRIPHSQLCLAEADHNLPVQQQNFIANKLEGFLNAKNGIVDGEGF